MSPVPKARLNKWIRILGDTDTEMSKVAAKKLGDMGDQDAVPALIEALETRTYDVCLEAARALGQLGDSRAVPALVRTMNSHHEILVQTAAAQSLGLIGDATAVQALKEVTEDYLKSYRNRYDRLHNNRRGLYTEAIRALKQIGTPEAIRIARKAESF